MSAGRCIGLQAEPKVMQQEDDSVENRVSTASLDGLVIAVLLGQPYCRRALETQSRLYARRLFNSLAKDLADDLHEDVFNESFVELMTAGPGALMNSTGRAAFRAAVLRAIRVVRASHTAPGQRTRPTPKPSQDRVAAEDIGRVADARTIERCTIGEGMARMLDFDRLANAGAAAHQRQVEDRLAADALLKLAPAAVRKALCLIHLDDEPVGAVAKHLHVSRFSLNRRIEAFCAPWRALG